MDIMIRKRDGHFEPLSVEKTKRMIAFACLGLDSCDPMELEMDSKLQFVDGMTTKQIQQTLIRTAIEKVIPSRHEGGGVPLQEMNPDWQFVAARLFLFDLYKEAAIQRRYKAFGYGNFSNLIHMLVDKKKYADFFVTDYTEDELQDSNSWQTVILYGDLTRKSMNCRRNALWPLPCILLSLKGKTRWPTPRSSMTL